MGVASIYRCRKTRADGRATVSFTYPDLEALVVSKNHLLSLCPKKMVVGLERND